MKAGPVETGISMRNRNRPRRPVASPDMVAGLEPLHVSPTRGQTSTAPSSEINDFRDLHPAPAAILSPSLAAGVDSLRSTEAR